MLAKQNTRFSMEAVYKNGDNTMLKVQWFLAFLSLGLASWYNTWTEALTVGLGTAIVCTVITRLQHGSRLSRITHGLAFMVFAALLIHQSRGMLEFHFSIFVLLAFLLFYRDWMVILAAAGLIAVHHLSFNMLQQSNEGIYIFESRSGFMIVFIHAGFVVFESVILIYMSILSKREAVQAEEITEIVEHLAVVDGTIDLSYNVENTRSPLGESLKQYVCLVRDAISEAKSSSEKISVSMTETAERNAEASHKTRQQQLETTQLASAIEEMSASFQEVSTNVNNTANVASETQSEVKAGDMKVTAVKQSISTMAETTEETVKIVSTLESDCKEIVEVVDLISNIAEQTNLLALNAAIEAARAGDAGRGFSVVADEVRNLAQSSAESTQRIQSIVNRLQSSSQHANNSMVLCNEKANEGAAGMNEVAEILTKVTASVGEVNAMNLQIASAVEEQVAVADEISNNVSQINLLSQDVDKVISTTSEQTNFLSDLTSRLTAQVDRFKTN